MKSLINYDKRVQNSLKSMIKTVLQEVSEHGLPGDHHFYISFFTQFEKVEISDWLIEKYPEIMTIIIQNWFADLHIEENYFSITLNFNNRPEKMIIPFNSLKSFSDPSVDFNIEFTDFENNQKMASESFSLKSESIKTGKTTPAEASEIPRDSENQGAEIEKFGEVISLDKFRKR